MEPSCCSIWFLFTVCYLHLYLSLTKKWSGSLLAPLHDFMSSMLLVFLLSIRVWSIWLFIFPSGDLHVCISLCRKQVEDTTMFFAAARAIDFFIIKEVFQTQCQMCVTCLSERVMGIIILFELKEHCTSMFISCNDTGWKWDFLYTSQYHLPWEFIYPLRWNQASSLMRMSVHALHKCTCVQYSFLFCYLCHNFVNCCLLMWMAMHLSYFILSWWHNCTCFMQVKPMICLEVLLSSINFRQFLFDMNLLPIVLLCRTEPDSENLIMLS